MTDKRMKQLRNLMREHGLDGVVLERPENHSAFLGARTYNGFAPEPPGRVAVFVPPDPSDRLVVVANRTEASRVVSEELDSAEALSYCWASPEQKKALLGELTHGLQVGADVAGYHLDLSPALRELRASLLPEEIEAYRELGSDCASTLEDCVKKLEPGLTEVSVAARLTGALLECDALPALVFVASGERLRHRHAVPTNKPIQKHLQLSITASRGGLFASLTRIIHFGKPSLELEDRQQVAATIDAHAIAWTRPGEKIGEIFRRVVQKYADCGWPEEWREHHQGGPTGYSGRELKATAAENSCVQPNQAWAWNPSIASGAKSEDTVLVTESGRETLTKSTFWPMITVDVEGTTLKRSGVLQI